MALTVAQLQAWRDGLMQARLAGVREFTDQNGESVRYATDREMAAAIAAADAQIAALAGRRPSTIMFKTSKGLDR